MSLPKSDGGNQHGYCLGVEAKFDAVLPLIFPCTIELRLMWCEATRGKLVLNMQTETASSRSLIYREYVGLALLC